MDSESTIGSTERPLRLAITGGGTGGHVSPGVAVLEELRSRVVVDPIWIGSKRGYERETAERLNIPYKPIRVGKLRRYLSFSNAVDAARIPVGIVDSWRHLRRHRPDLLFSTGGYVSTPAVIAASLLRIPSLTHDQTAHIGLATKLNARFVDVVALSYERSRSMLGTSRARVIVTGNPVRQAILNGCSTTGFAQFGFDPDVPLIYVTGGSLGAHGINETVGEALLDLLPRVQIVHQCGPRTSHHDIDVLKSLAERLPDARRTRYIVVERIGSELGDLYAAASLVVSRAGAGTIAELASVGLPSILVPLPQVEEQRQNALYLEGQGAAVIVHQEDFTPQRLAGLVHELLDNPTNLTSMRDAARLAATPHAAERLVDELFSLIRICPTPRREPH